MKPTPFEFALLSVALVFTAAFGVLIIPALLQDRDIIGAFASGFVNPYASGYSTDVILCWVVLGMWTIRDARVHAIKYGWICLALGLVPGVAVGFPLYLILRGRQLTEHTPHPSS